MVLRGYLDKDFIMKIKTILLGLLLMVGNSHAATTPTVTAVDTEQFGSNQNILKNAGFEPALGTTFWTASGGALTTTTTAANVGRGSRSASWDSNGAAQTFTSSALTIPAGLYGVNAIARCRIQTPSGTATHTLAAHDGTNSYNATTVTSSTGYVLTQINFIMPSNGTIAIQIKSVNANEPSINIDDCYLGVADNIGSGPITTPDTSTTLTPSAGFGTTSGQSSYVGRLGDKAFFRGFFVAGTVSASISSIALPTGCLIDSTNIKIGRE